VPFVADGVVYAVNYANRIYALDAKTGKLLWEFGKGSTKFTASAVGPVAVDGVVVACIGEMVGLDAKTGKELWKGPAGNIRPWQHVGRTWIIATGADVGRKGAAPMNVWCVEPKIGRVAWKAETPLWGAGDVYPIVEGDYLIGYDATKGEKAGEADFSRNTLVRCYRLKEDGVEPLWAVPAPYPAIDKFALCAAGGNVYVAGAAETFCLSLGDGRKLGTAKAGGARTQKMFVADGRVLIQPEGRHGGQAFFQLDADPAAFRLLPASGGGATKHTGEGQWVPPHTHDTAYANHPVGYPLIDGRLFVRGHDGIYCYDLRAAGNEKGR
jgi:outer membrane protein assembly factor BamB